MHQHSTYPFLLFSAPAYFSSYQIELPRQSLYISSKLHYEIKVSVIMRVAGQDLELVRLGRMGIYILFYGGGRAKRVPLVMQEDGRRQLGQGIGNFGELCLGDFQWKAHKHTTLRRKQPAGIRERGQYRADRLGDHYILIKIFSQYIRLTDFIFQIHFGIRRIPMPVVQRPNFIKIRLQHLGNLPDPCFVSRAHAAQYQRVHSFIIPLALV